VQKKKGKKEDEEKRIKNSEIVKYDTIVLDEL
jgi:hypothetical protein